MNISVITPTLNSFQHIEKTIHSVLDQTYNNWEHVIIDGGSTDNTLDIIKKYDHLKWISEQDNGVYDAMNKGIHLAKGDWDWFIRAERGRTKFINVSKYLSIYRKHGLQKTQYRDPIRYKELKKIIDKYNNEDIGQLYRELNDQFENMVNWDRKIKRYGLRKFKPQIRRFKFPRLYQHRYCKYLPGLIKML